MSGRVFLYHGNAVGLGGSLMRPFAKVMESQASATLPIVGGYASARTQDYRIPELLSFKEARTSVAGNESEDAYNTSVSSTVEGLKVLDVISCDAITGRLSLRHVKDDEEPEIITTGSTFQNLRIGGYPVEVEINPYLDEFSKYSTLKDQFGQNDGFKQSLLGEFASAPQRAQHPKMARIRERLALPGQGPVVDFPESKGMVRCSIVTSVQCEAPGVVSCGHVLYVPDFGYLVLGEMFLSPHGRRLTMLRLHLGSPVQGDLAIAGGEGNGTTYP
jgi:hypothetical protein